MVVDVGAGHFTFILVGIIVKSLLISLTWETVQDNA